MGLVNNSLKLGVNVIFDSNSKSNIPLLFTGLSSINRLFELSFTPSCSSNGVPLRNGPHNKDSSPHALFEFSNGAALVSNAFSVPKRLYSIGFGKSSIENLLIFFI